MAKKNSGKYYLRNTANGAFIDVTQMFDGVNILSINGFDARGKALNVYLEQWVTGETDFQIASEDGQIVRENLDITVVFVVGERYANGAIDTQSVYDRFVDFMTNTDVWVRSRYVNKQVHCVALDGVEPKSVRLMRGNDSYILGEMKLRCIGQPAAI